MGMTYLVRGFRIGMKLQFSDVTMEVTLLVVDFTLVKFRESDKISYSLYNRSSNVI